MSNARAEQLKKLILECKNILDKEDTTEAAKQILKICKVYIDIKHFNVYPDYEYDLITNNQIILYNSPEQLNRLEELILEMEIYHAELLDEYNMQQNQTNSKNININNQNNNTANASINQNITIESTIKDINKIPDNILDKEAKGYLEEILYSIEALKDKEKDKAKEKIFKALKYIIDKGFEVGIAILPYLVEVSKILR